MSIKEKTKIDSITQFLSEAKNELQKVNWPTKDQAVKLTFIVLGTSVFVTIFITTFDYIFSEIINLILK